MVQVLSDLFDSLERIVAILASFLEGAFGIPANQARLISGLVLTALVVRVIVWGLAPMNAASLKPQTIVLSTSKTPWEVVWGDITGCLSKIFLIVIIAAVIYLVLSIPESG